MQVFFLHLRQKYPVLQNEARLLFDGRYLQVALPPFASFGLETFQLLKQGQSGLAFSYAISSVVIGVSRIGFGILLISIISKNRCLKQTL